MENTRRRSLFSCLTKLPNPTTLPPNVYPNEYMDKVQKEISEWENVAKDISQLEKKFCQKLQKSTVNEEILSEEHKQYLSTLVDLKEYVQLATDFINRSAVTKDEAELDLKAKQEIITTSIALLRRKKSLYFDSL